MCERSSQTEVHSQESKIERVPSMRCAGGHKLLEFCQAWQSPQLIVGKRQKSGESCQQGLGRVIGVVGVCYAHSYLSQHSPQKQT